MSRPQKNNFDLGDLIKPKELENGNRNLGTKIGKYICCQLASFQAQTSTRCDEGGSSSNHSHPGKEDLHN